MTYKLNPIVALITSPVALVFPAGARHEFASGTSAAQKVFGERYEIEALRAVDGIVEIDLRPTENLRDESETFF